MDSQTRPKYMVRVPIETSAIPHTQPIFETRYETIKYARKVKALRAVADALGIEVYIPGEVRP